ncbi:hypothetical protein GGX14DRAFT_409161 [Mycena pura]|uniref:Uncharacterized protein n=1 Tax=Mycena pura TaxID=153505 RepID=A0AAD6ULH4_9AGAR|nr:hypothetical protein GGX14DRAFT_409161 [Mycena pura]
MPVNLVPIPYRQLVAPHCRAFSIAVHRTAPMRAASAQKAVEAARAPSALRRRVGIEQSTQIGGVQETRSLRRRSRHPSPLLPPPAADAPASDPVTRRRRSCRRANRRARNPPPPLTWTAATALAAAPTAAPIARRRCSPRRERAAAYLRIDKLRRRGEDLHGEHACARVGSGCAKKGTPTTLRPMHAACDALGLGVDRVLGQAELKERWRKRRERSSQLMDRLHFVPSDPGWHSSPASHRHQNEHNPRAPNTTHRHKHRVLLVRALQEAPVRAHRTDGAEDAPGRSARVARAQIRPAMHDQRVQRLQLAEARRAGSQERAHAVVQVARAQHAVPEQRAHERGSRRVTVRCSQAPRGSWCQAPSWRASRQASGLGGGRPGSRSSRRTSGRAGRHAIERAGGRASGAAELRRCTIFRLRRRPWRPFGGRCEVEVGDRKRLANGR